MATTNNRDERPSVPRKATPPASEDRPDPPAKGQEHTLRYLLGVVYRDEGEEAREREEATSRDNRAQRRATSGPA